MVVDWDCNMEFTVLVFWQLWSFFNYVVYRRYVNLTDAQVAEDKRCSPGPKPNPHPTIITFESGSTYWRLRRIHRWSVWSETARGQLEETDEIKNNKMNRGNITLSSLTGGSSVWAGAGGVGDPHSLPPAKHGANHLWGWSGETVASHERGYMAFLEGLCAYLASWMVLFPPLLCLPTVSYT